ncbi:MAG: M15 family metallopeptidase [Rhizobiaceae bacterium]
MLPLLLTNLISLAAAQSSIAADLPRGFIYLSKIAPDIQQHMAYAGPDNFFGRPARGYEAPACILTEKAAKALSRAQRVFTPKNLSLVVLDCYRPESAVRDFASWVDAGGNIDPLWSPKTPRNQLIKQGYIGRRSAHSRGSTVDIAIVSNADPTTWTKPTCGIAMPNTLDFGSGFDCFDAISRTTYRPLSEAAIANRKLLLDTMKAAGFRNYAGEWWHFTLMGEPFPKKRFDFPIRAAE